MPVLSSLLVFYPQVELRRWEEAEVFKASVSPRLLGACPLLLRVALKALNKISFPRGGPYTQGGQKKSTEIVSMSIFCIFLFQKPEHPSQP